ncbi:MAG: protease inhibitor I42 family protein [Elusimicrobiales bacterium]
MGKFALAALAAILAASPCSWAMKHELAAEDNNQPVAAEPGDVIVVTLVSNPETGVWKLLPATRSAFIVLREDFRPFQGGQQGEDGEYMLELKVRRHGASVISLRYLSWENGSYSRSFDVPVSVTEKNQGEKDLVPQAF